MKKTLCLVFAMVLLLSACGGRPDPVPSPTLAPEQTAAAVQTPTPDPEAEGTQDPPERAIAWLRAQKDWNFVGAHLGTYQELYELTHPGADIQILGGGIGAKEVFIEVAGTDAKAFAEAGYFSDRFTIHTRKNGDPCFSMDLPIPWEPESDHISDRGVRITMDRAVWPVGTEYLRFTVEANLENGKFCLEKYADGTWIRYDWPGISFGNDLGLLRSAQTRFLQTQFLPRLGEGLYRIFVSPEGDWAEFVVRADAEPLDLEPLVRKSWPEAALLLAGLPENAETDLRETDWPAMSHTWRVTEERSRTDEELAELLLGKKAEYDPAEAVWRAGELILSTEEGIRVEDGSLLVRALRLVLPLRGQETPDPREIPSLEEAGWKRMSGVSAKGCLGIAKLYPNEGFRVYSPDPDVLNARLEAALEALGPEDPRAAELADFRFTQEDASELRLALLPIQTRAAEYMLTKVSLVSPWGEMDEAAAWCVYRKDKGILLLEARYPDHRLEPEDAWETLSPEEQIEKFLPLMEGEEEGLRLTRMDYVLIPGNEEGVFQPAWRLLAETASGEERTWVASTRNDRQSAYDLQQRAYFQNLQKKIPGLFQAYREQHPDMDVWVNSWGLDRLEDGKEYLAVGCHGADIPALEASGVLPEGVVLDWMESPFNQKESHPCPHEPEWEKNWGTLCFTMTKMAYPPYPEAVELTVSWEKAFKLESVVCKKYVEGDWRHVCRVQIDAPLPSDTEGETTLQAYPLAKLGPGLYRLYMNDKFWVEFKVTDRTAEN